MTWSCISVAYGPLPALQIVLGHRNTQPRHEIAGRITLYFARVAKCILQLINCIYINLLILSGSELPHVDYNNKKKLNFQIFNDSHHNHLICEQNYKS